MTSPVLIDVILLAALLVDALATYILLTRLEQAIQESLE